MKLTLYLDFLTPPGALAFESNLQPDGETKPDIEEECLAIFFRKALDLTITNLANQMIAARQNVRGEKSGEYYLKQWRKQRRPLASVMFGDGLYMLIREASPPGQHPLVAQAWPYLKTALDVVSDDACANLIFPDPHSYEATLPLRLLAAHNKLPKLNFV